MAPGWQRCFMKYALLTLIGVVRARPVRNEQEEKQNRNERLLPASGHGIPEKQQSASCKGIEQIAKKGYHNQKETDSTMKGWLPLSGGHQVLQGDNQNGRPGLKYDKDR